MECFAFDEHPMTKDKLPLSDKAKQLKSKFMTLCDSIKANTPCSQSKGNIKISSYTFETGTLAVREWFSDAERQISLWAGDMKVGLFFDCWGKGHLEILNEKTLDKLLLAALSHQEKAAP